LTAVRTGDTRPLIAHVVYRFDVGGLENGVVNLINHMPADRYRHAVVALTEVTPFRQRVLRDDVEYVELRKGPGHGYRIFPALYRLFRRLAPAIVHTRNLAALEAVAPAWLARMPVRIHGEHGRDIGDFDGTNRANQLTRRLYRPFVQQYVALSRDLEAYLVNKVGVAPGRISQIYNGVDAERFAPSPEPRVRPRGCPFTEPDLWLVGTVGRMQVVKDQVTLARAFARAATRGPRGARMRLVLAGDGPLRSQVEDVLAEGGVLDRVWFAGDRTDIPDVLRGLDCFVLPSRAEGISNAILEAMATGLPIVATRVGGTPELVDDGVTGRLVPPADPEAMALALEGYANDPDMARAHGSAAREAVLDRFSLARMVRDYASLYDGAISMPARARAPGARHLTARSR
jgi:sugar transferase (PEP-CTERM/EpsH1 system associated)